MSVPQFGHFFGPLFQVCGSEGGAVPIDEAIFFHGLGFLVENFGDVESEPPYSSCGVLQFGDIFHLYLSFLIFHLYEEGGEAEPQLI